ncbi:MAG TPA: NUDIX domain-containing protein [Candidatus Saccharimonadales bacterium]|nr:NUDIX domain-containing protein [Candidatus Saccharimonadales bacterium]
MEESYHLGIKGLIRDRKGKILLLKVNPAKLHGKADYWDLPGGRVQKGDSIEETFKREIAEEISIDEIQDVKPLAMVMSNIRIPVGDDSVGLILGIYQCKILDGSDIRISDEHIAFDWFEPRKAAKLLKVKYPEDFCEVIGSL